jgi:hypothetical protein
MRKCHNKSKTLVAVLQADRIHVLLHQKYDEGILVGSALLAGRLSATLRGWIGVAASILLADTADIKPKALSAGPCQNGIVERRSAEVSPPRRERR